MSEKKSDTSRLEKELNQIEKAYNLLKKSDEEFDKAIKKRLEGNN